MGATDRDRVLVQCLFGVEGGRLDGEDPVFCFCSRLRMFGRVFTPFNNAVRVKSVGDGSPP
jgi:hypothetical protein